MRGCRKGSNELPWLETNVEDCECFLGNVNHFQPAVRSPWSWPYLFMSKPVEYVCWFLYIKWEYMTLTQQEVSMFSSFILWLLSWMFLSHAVTNGSSHSPTALNGAPSPPNGYSNGPSSSSSSSLANQQLPPACGARQLSKLKRFLTTLQQFGNDISPEIGERVRTLVLGLVVSGYCVWASLEMA